MARKSKKLKITPEKIDLKNLVYLPGDHALYPDEVSYYDNTAMCYRTMRAPAWLNVILRRQYKDGFSAGVNETRRAIKMAMGL